MVQTAHWLVKNNEKLGNKTEAILIFKKVGKKNACRHAHESLYSFFFINSCEYV